jgi:hypothetical protein
VPIDVQLRDWALFLKKAESALKVLGSPPEGREDIFSKKTLDIFESSKAAIEVAEEWRYSAATYLSNVPLHIEKVVSEAREMLFTNIQEADKAQLITKLEKAIKQYGRTAKLLCVLAEAHAKAGNIEIASRLQREAVRVQVVNDDAERREIERTFERLQEEQIVKAYELLSNNEFEAADKMFRLVISNGRNTDERELLKFRFANELRKINRSFLLRLPKFFSAYLS